MGFSRIKAAPDTPPTVESLGFLPCIEHIIPGSGKTGVKITVSLPDQFQVDVDSRAFDQPQETSAIPPGIFRIHPKTASSGIQFLLQKIFGRNSMLQILPFMGFIQFRSVDIKEPDAFLFFCYSSTSVEVCLEGIAIDGF